MRRRLHGTANGTVISGYAADSTGISPQNSAGALQKPHRSSCCQGAADMGRSKQKAIRLPGTPPHKYASQKYTALFRPSIPDHSSAYSCEDAYEDDQKTVITVSCVDRRTAADHRKYPKADRIADQHDPVIPDCKASGKELLPDIGNKKRSSKSLPLPVHTMHPETSPAA